MVEVVEKVNRECGECVSCCVHLPFVSGKVMKKLKLPHTPCDKLNDNMIGCSVYENRPDSCCKYMCLWALGDKRLSEEMRPDKSGLLIHLKPFMNGEDSLVFTENDPDAFRRNVFVICDFLAQEEWKSAILVLYNGKEVRYSLPYRFI